MKLDEITFERRDGVGLVTLNRPDQLNPISARPGGTRDQILWALQAAANDGAIGCVVVTGAGRAFSSGGDLTGNTPRDTPAEELAFVEAADAFHAGVRSSPLPVLAAVHGYCLGAGLALATACDLVIAGEGARFGVPEARIGLIGATALVPTIGRQWAKFLAFTGELIDATRACEVGIVLTTVPDDEVLARTIDLAGRIAGLPREAVQFQKRAIDAEPEAGRALDALTLANRSRALAPDGRSFATILAEEGMAGVKAQYREPWLD